MQNDDTIKVPTWRPDPTPTSQPARALRKQVQATEQAPDDKKANPAPKAVETPKPERREPITTEELAENLRRMNMTFDLFEIQAKFIIDEEDNDIKIIVRNTKTGDIIRVIPPSEFNALYDRFTNGLGTTFNSLV